MSPNPEGGGYIVLVRIPYASALASASTFCFRALYSEPNNGF